MYPMALMCLLPLSGERVASFPHVLDTSWLPPVPNPILESNDEHPVKLFPTMPILAFELLGMLHLALKPSLLQLTCKEPSEPISDFHVARPSEVSRYCPPAISEYLVSWPAC